MIMKKKIGFKFRSVHILTKVSAWFLKKNFLSLEKKKEKEYIYVRTSPF